MSLEKYGYADIYVAETAFAERLMEMTQATLDAFSGHPMLKIDIMGSFSGDYQVFRIPELDKNRNIGFVLYGNIVFSGIFGQLTVYDGPILLSGMDYVIPVPGIEINEMCASGHNWELKVNSGYIISKLPALSIP